MGLGQSTNLQYEFIFQKRVNHNSGNILLGYAEHALSATKNRTVGHPKYKGTFNVNNRNLALPYTLKNDRFRFGPPSISETLFKGLDSCLVSLI